MSERLGRCYELAGEQALDPYGVTVLDTPWGEVAPVALHHGTIQRDPWLPNPHAWVEYERDLWWEPVTESLLPRDAFERSYGTTVIVRYEIDEARRLAVRTGHWGPWEDQ